MQKDVKRNDQTSASGLIGEAKKSDIRDEFAAIHRSVALEYDESMCGCPLSCEDNASERQTRVATIDSRVEKDNKEARQLVERVVRCQRDLVDISRGAILEHSKESIVSTEAMECEEACQAEDGERCHRQVLHCVKYVCHSPWILLGVGSEAHRSVIRLLMLRTLARLADEQLTERAAIGPKTIS